MAARTVAHEDLAETAKRFLRVAALLLGSIVLKRSKPGGGDGPGCLPLIGQETSLARVPLGNRFVKLPEEFPRSRRRPEDPLASAYGIGHDGEQLRGEPIPLWCSPYDTSSTR
jgi:hypothetical protein